MLTLSPALLRLLALFRGATPAAADAEAAASEPRCHVCDTPLNFVPSPEHTRAACEQCADD